MTAWLLDDLDVPWTSSGAALATAADTGVFVADGPSSMRLEATAGALGASAESVLAAPLDLSAHDELRFWVRADRAAARDPLLELSYTDANDAPGEEHRWLVYLSRPHAWELRRVGIENDRRSAVTRFRLRCSSDQRFTAHVDHLLAVREELVADAERALLDHLERALRGLGPGPIALSQPALPGSGAVVFPLTPGFAPGNVILLAGGVNPPERHLVHAVTSDAGTTLTFPAGEAVAGSFAAGTGTVTLLFPAVVDAPALATVPSPAVRVTPLEVREDPERSGHVLQRDSFRPRGSGTVCSVRPAARAWMLDYQLTISAPDRTTQREIIARLLARLSPDVPLWIDGAPAPLTLLPAPPLEGRAPGQPAPIYVRIGTRGETAARRETPFPKQTGIRAAPRDAPLEGEGIRVDL